MKKYYEKNIMIKMKSKKGNIEVIITEISLKKKKKRKQSME